MYFRSEPSSLSTIVENVCVFIVNELLPPTFSIPKKSPTIVLSATALRRKPRSSSEGWATNTIGTKRACSGGEANATDQDREGEPDANLGLEGALKMGRARARWSLLHPERKEALQPGLRKQAIFSETGATHANARTSLGKRTVRESGLARPI